MHTSFPASPAAGSQHLSFHYAPLPSLHSVAHGGKALGQTFGGQEALLSVGCQASRWVEKLNTELQQRQAVKGANRVHSEKGALQARERRAEDPRKRSFEVRILRT